MTLQIGITGGIGAGKSIITRIFSMLGVPIYDADSNAKRLMTNDEHLKTQIKQLFGEAAYLPDGSLDRKYLSRKAFSNPENLKKLNNLVHPAVGLHFKKWVHTNSNAPYILKEAALLFESLSYKKLDKIITVFAPERIRLERTLKRDIERSEEQIKAIMKNQMAEEEKVRKADFVIYNDDSQLIIPQVIAIDKLLRTNLV